MIQRFLSLYNCPKVLHQLLKHKESNLYNIDIIVRNMSRLSVKKSGKKSLINGHDSTQFLGKDSISSYNSNHSTYSTVSDPYKVNTPEISKDDSDSHDLKTSKALEKLKSMSKCFGKKPEFNFMIYNNDNVLNCLTIKQRLMGFTVDWDVQMIGNLAHCKYTAKIPKGNVISGETTALNKKLAKKEAARDILSKLPVPTFEELEENSKWIISGHKSVVGVVDNIVDRNFLADGHSCKIEWKIDDEVFHGTGEAKTVKEAELYANQELYVKTHNIKKSVPDTSEPSSAKRKINEVVFEEELSKSDASQMNILRNSVSAKMKVNQQEKVVSCPGGFQCTLTWVWKDANGSYNKKVVCKQGSSKALARASASKAMLVEVGTIQDVTAEESKCANEIRNKINQNLKKAVDLSCELIERSNCSVWRLFLSQLWDEIVKKRDYLAAQRVINSMESAQSSGKNHLPTDLWEMLLDNIIYVMDDEFARSMFQQLRSLQLNVDNFYSQKARDYYQNNSILLCMESQCCIFNEIILRREMEHLYINQMLVMDVVRMQLPLATLKTQITPEYLKNNSTREDDIVMLLPLNKYNQITPKSWDLGVICSVTKHKTEGLNLNLGLKYLADLKIKKSEDANLVNNEHLLLNRSSTGFNRNKHSKSNKYDEIESDDVFNCTSFGVFHIQTMVTHIRMMEALQALTHSAYPINSNASKYDFTYEMKEVLLHSKNTSQIPNVNQMLPTTMSLTPSQHLACISAILNPVTLIQGPPGTGKTHVACAIIDCWSKMNPNVRILAVADSNVAADNLIEGLAKKNITALRIGASSEWDLQEEAIKGLPRYNNYLQLRMSGMHKEANSLRVLLFTEAIKKHTIVIATCVGSGNEILSAHTFPYVIIDECAQSIEASNLIPIGRGCKSLVLIGDHKQLRPTIISMQASTLGLNKSLLERLIEENVSTVHLLDVQRRMHPSIAEFPNLHFYNGLIRNQDVNDLNRPQIDGFRWPVQGNNVVFVDVSTGSPNSQFETSHGTSKFNTMELTCVLALLKTFLQSGDVKESQIGILTPYDAQRGMIRKNVNYMKEYKTNQIEIDSVDGFQGKEKDLIIFSAVRSNLSKEIGFLKDPRRMNVMLTRAKRGLIILGDIYTLMNDKQNWGPFLNWIYSKQLNIHVSQLNNYMLYRDDNLPKSHEDIYNLDERFLKSDSTGKRKNPFEFSQNDANQNENEKIVEPYN